MQKRYLKSALDNNNSIYVHSALDEYGTPGVFIQTLKQEGDIIIGYDVEGKEKFRGTLDEIAEAEANAIKDQLSERTELLSQAIATGSYEDVKYLFDKNED